MATENTVEVQVRASIFQKCLPKTQFGLKCGPQYSRSVYRNHNWGSSVGLNTPEVFTEITIWVEAWASILEKCLPTWQLRLKCGRQYSRSVYRNHSLGPSVGVNAPEVFTEIRVEAQVWASILQKCLPKYNWKSTAGLNTPEVFTEMTVQAQVWVSILQKCLPKSQLGIKCGHQYSRNVYRNHSWGSSVGLNTPEVFTKITVWVQVWASMPQKCLPKWQLKFKCGPQCPRSVYQIIVCAQVWAQNIQILAQNSHIWLRTLLIAMLASKFWQ